MCLVVINFFKLMYLNIYRLHVFFSNLGKTVPYFCILNMQHSLLSLILSPILPLFQVMAAS